MLHLFKKTKKSDKIIKRYINGVVNKKYEESHQLATETLKFTLKRKLFKAIIDFLENVKFLDDKNEQMNEIEIYGHAHGLGSKIQMNLFFELLRLSLNHKQIIEEYSQGNEIITVKPIEIEYK